MNSTEMNLTLYGKPLAMLPYLVLNAMNILIGTFGEKKINIIQNICLFCNNFCWCTFIYYRGTSRA